MLIILSPTKTLQPAKARGGKTTLPQYLEKSALLVEELKKFSVDDLMKTMNISPELARLNFERFKKWKLPFDRDNAFPSLFAFKGEVFRGLDAETLSEEEISFAQSHLRILSGLYGVLRPLDIIMPYRLEMGTKHPFCGKKNLYEFWKETITQALGKALSEQGDSFLVNLASNEYFNGINTKILDAQIITPEFKEFKNGAYKTVTIYTKKARGLMARFILQNKITNPEQFALFDSDGYYFNPSLTKDKFRPVFTRG